MAELAALQQTLDVSFHTPSLLEQALTHSSFANENPGTVSGSNERLEFLGDAVLGFIIAEKLYLDYPSLTEGDMTRLRSAVVRREALARVAKSINLGDYLYLGKGEEASGGRAKPANLASVLEAVIAAIFLDQGLVVVREFTLRVLAEELENVIGMETAIDYKSQLQEITQSTEQLTPTYRMVEATGPDHDRVFTAEVMAGDRVLGRGSGKSKKLAETEAARSALERLSADFTR